MDRVTVGTREGVRVDGTAPGLIRVDEGQVRAHVEEVVRGTVEETLNALLDAEADRVCNAKRYERSPDRQGGITKTCGWREDKGGVLWVSCVITQPLTQGVRHHDRSYPGSIELST